MLGLVTAFFKKGERIQSPFNDSHLQYDELSSLLQKYGGNHVSHLIFLKDKELFWTKERNVVIVYKRIANKLIVLGDPVGDQTKFNLAIKEFCEYSKSRCYKPVFYQISPEYMRHYHDSGFRFLKVGEEGLVNLQQFSIEGKQGSKLRTRVNKFTRNSFTFRVVHPPYSNLLLSELKNISDSWLGSQKEKGFSVVSFSKEYVSRFPIAILQNPEGKALAFATLAAYSHDTVSIDLMRKTADCPHGTMDVLFIHIFQWAKNNGFQTYSLGMSPLSNVGSCEHSFTNEKLIRLAYLHGNSMYNFKGLNEFKSKFATDWEPKYIAYKKSILPVTILQLLILINYKPGHLENTIRKNNSLKNAITKWRFE